MPPSGDGFALGDAKPSPSLVSSESRSPAVRPCRSAGRRGCRDNLPPAACESCRQCVRAPTSQFCDLGSAEGWPPTAALAGGAATSLAAGGVAGYFESTSVQQGEEGTPIPQETRQYISRTKSSSVTIYPVATDEVYTGAGGTGGQTTSTSYSWFSGTDQPQTMTLDRPRAGQPDPGPGPAVTCQTTHTKAEAAYRCFSRCASRLASGRVY
jgi:hypothetical protein